MKSIFLVFGIALLGSQAFGADVCSSLKEKLPGEYRATFVYNNGQSEAETFRFDLVADGSLTLTQIANGAEQTDAVSFKAVKAGKQTACRLTAGVLSLDSVLVDMEKGRAIFTAKEPDFVFSVTLVKNSAN
jgi:hypothetical protein